MPRIPFVSLRMGLVLLVLLTILPPFVLAVYTSLEQRRLGEVELKADTLRISRLVAANQEHLVEGARQMLIALAQFLEVQAQNRGACNLLFAGLLDQYTHYSVFGAADLAGDVFCSSSPSSSTCNVSGHSWFQSSVQTRGFAVGQYEVGCISKEPTVFLSYPVFDDGGRVRGVVFAGLDLLQINPFTADAELPEGGVLEVIDRDGTILASYPNTTEWTGTSIRDSTLAKAILEKREGVLQTIGEDGVARITAFTPLHGAVDTGIHVSIGIPVDIGLAGTERILHRNLVGLILAGGLAVIVAWSIGSFLILRRVNTLLGATQRLASGDLSARSGFRHGRSELSRLAKAFDKMAASLEGRTQQLRRAEARYRTLVEQIPAVTYSAVIGNIAGTLYISPQIEKMTGFTVEEMRGDLELWRRQLHPDDRDRVLAETRTCYATGNPCVVEYRFLTRDGRTVWLRNEAVVKPDESGRHKLLQGLMLDITERHEAEEKLRTYQMQLRSLASQLSLAEERERRRIATDLHDRIGQKLAMSKIKLETLQQKVSSVDFAESLDQIHELLDQTIQDTRSLTYTISSPILYELGLEEALEWLTEEVQSQHGLSCSFEKDDQPKPVEHDIRVILFHAVNELLVNVTKHAEARHARVSIHRDGEYVTVEVEDDGEGFDYSQIMAQRGKMKGFGLFSIRERLNPLGGQLEVESSPGQGTLVRLIAPLKYVDTDGLEEIT